MGDFCGVLRCPVLRGRSAGLCRKSRARGLFAETGKARADGLLPAGYDGMAGEEAFHRGTDLACSEGTLVLAAMNGVVIAARRSATYGNYLCLSHSGGQETLYAHLQYLFVRAGEVVQAGQPLGTAGETGRSTGAHLHFELLEQGVRYDAGALLGLP